MGGSKTGDKATHHGVDGHGAFGASFIINNNAVKITKAIMNRTIL